MTEPKLARCWANPLLTMTPVPPCTVVLSQPLECEKLSEAFQSQFVMCVFTPGQELAMDFDGLKLKIIVESVSTGLRTACSAVSIPR